MTTAREILENIYYDSDHEIDFQDSIDQAIKYLCDLIGREKRELGEMRYGGCNPDEDRGFNLAIDHIIALLRKE